MDNTLDVYGHLQGAEGVMRIAQIRWHNVVLPLHMRNFGQGQMRPRHLESR